MELNAQSPPLAQSFCTAGPVETGTEENLAYSPHSPDTG